MRTIIVLSLAALCFGMWSQECDPKTLSTALQSLEFQLNKIKNNKVVDQDSMFFLNSVVVKSSSAIGTCLFNKSWKGKVVTQNGDERRQMEEIIRLALRINDDSIIHYLFYAFDIQSTVPNVEDLRETFNPDYWKEHEPERFVPAAIGL